MAFETTLLIRFSRIACNDDKLKFVGHWELKQ